MVTQRVKYRCPLCDYTNGTFPFVTRHIFNTHKIDLEIRNEEENAFEKENSTEDENILEEDPNETSENIFEHSLGKERRKESLELKHSCDICEKTFSSLKSVLAHRGAAHKMIKTKYQSQFVIIDHYKRIHMIS